MHKETEMQQLKRVILNPANPKVIKQAALNQLRVLERAAGVKSIPYNSPAFAA